MRNRLLLSYMTITIVVLVAFGVPLGIAFGNSERRQLKAGLQHDAFALVLRVEEALRNGDPAKLAKLPPLVEQYQRDTKGRVVVVNAQGYSVADSDPPPDSTSSTPRYFADREEIAKALGGGESTGSRYSSTLGETLEYVSVPVVSDGKVIGAVRLSYPSSFVENKVRRTWIIIGIAGLIILLLVFFVSLALARSVARPLEELEGTAVRLGDGELDARAAVPDKPVEVRVLAEQFNHTAARLEQLVNSQRAFVADASHQLRTPLAAMRLRIENLSYEVGDAGQDDIDGALAEVQRLSKLVDALLALARAEQETSAPEPIALAALLDERRSAWQALSDERGVRFAIAVPPDVKVAATPGHLDQVFDNLINNALEVAPAGSALDIRAVADGDRIIVRFGDAGPGMTEEQRARAFDRFWRAPNARRGAGSGLGLAIINQLVLIDGGMVELGVSPLGGLEVVLRLRSANVSLSTRTRNGMEWI